MRAPFLIATKTGVTKKDDPQLFNSVDNLNAETAIRDNAPLRNLSSDNAVVTHPVRHPTSLTNGYIPSLSRILPIAKVGSDSLSARELIMSEATGSGDMSGSGFE